METIRLRTVSELTDYFAQLERGKSVFRGQTEQYEDSAGNVSITSSIGRQGCVPSRMRQWSYYANAILHALCGRPMWADRNADLALLQHYGWRSFFVDASTSPAVAAWFASHKFSKSLLVEIVELESCDSVFAHRDYAQYSPAEADGYVYVAGRAELARNAVGVVDLEQCWPNDKWRTRMLAQHAAMLGPLSHGRVAASAITACVRAPADALREFAAREGFVTMEQLFPGRLSDPVLNCLLSVPWELAGPRSYRRPLTLPEYEPPRKGDLANDAFYSKPAWISGDRPPPLADAMFFKVPELLSYATGPAVDELSHALDELVTEHGTVVIETEGLLMHPQLVGRPEFGKGLVVTSVQPGTVDVAELIVEHPGTQITFVGVNLGCRYQTDGSKWVRAPTPEDCPCKDAARHDHLLAMATYLPSMINGNEFRETERREMTHTTFV